MPFLPDYYCQVSFKCTYKDFILSWGNTATTNRHQRRQYVLGFRTGFSRSRVRHSTVEPLRLHIPSKMNIGETQNFRKNQMLLCAFREKKSQREPVQLLSISEAVGMTQVQTRAGIIKRKPRGIAAYNRYLGGVDISDRKIYYVSVERPSKRYGRKYLLQST